MADKIRTLEEAKQLLAEYNALPDDLTARLNWTGYGRLPDYQFTCVCGYNTTYPMGMDDLIQIIEKGWEFKLGHYQERCWGHDDEKDDEEEPEEDES